MLKHILLFTNEVEMAIVSLSAYEPIGNDCEYPQMGQMTTCVHAATLKLQFISTLWFAMETTGSFN